ncbi:pyrimidine reductase family protein [Microbacterium hominis]|uniref:Pyrimidine reductase family protein n=1 Tax=Microbacterium hominis TaxID=162426 RepID=A0A7D4QBU1_9MICO|nr:pyrimidine reductase family protein [Microbacterium hominis]QKJ18837.1 pyrimidine reductase family protein [Microbacterium hominis]
MLPHEALVEAYALEDRTTPRIRMNFVSSIDGAATVAGRSADLGGETDRAVMQVLRAMCDVILVGAGTVRAEGYGGTRVEGEDAAWRRAAGLTGQPRLAVVSRALDLDAAHPFFTEAVVRPLVVTCATAPADRRAALGAVADVLVCGEASVDLAAARERLEGLGMPQILCEGGPHLFGALHAADLVDELCLTLSPRLAGGEAGRILRGGAERVTDMGLAGLLREGDWLFLRYAR